MIRAFNSDGELIIGLSRKVVEKLLATDLRCTSVPQSPGDCPMIVHIYIAETDEAIMEKMKRDHGGKGPDEIIDNRTKWS